MKRYFANLKLSAKLGAGFGLCLVLAFAMGVVAIQQFGVIGQATSNAAYATKMLGIADNLETDVLKQTRAVKTLLIVTSDADNAKYSAEAKELYKQVQDDIDNLKKETKTEAGRKTAQIASESWSAFQPINDEVVALGLANKNQEADKVLIEKGGPILETLEKSLTEYREAKLKESADAGKLAQVAGEEATKLVLAFLFFAILSGVVAATLLTKAITKVVAQIRERLQSVTERCASDLTLGLEALARGDLTVPAVAVTQPLGINTTDELGQISQTFDLMLAKFHGMIASYTKAKDSLGEVVHQLAQSSIQVSSTSQTLAATAQETGAASSEIASGSYKLATNSSEASQIVDRLVEQVKTVGESSRNQLDLVSESSQVLAQASSGIEEVAAAAETMAATANEGNRSVGETVSAMSRIQATVATSSARVAELAEKGQQIGDIVSVIEGIAEQTNLLALNAAIEAARAGEQGRGFAVVAEEVRKLAEEAGSSTRKVADLIGSVKTTVQETVKAIEETTAEAKIGSEKSEKAGLALKEILQNAEEVAVQAESVANLTTNATHSIGAVAAAAKANAELASEMAAGADQVGSAITSVAAFSEQAAASAEELSASVEEVGASASELAKMSQDLETIVSTFKVDNQSAQSRNKLKVAA